MALSILCPQHCPPSAWIYEAIPMGQRGAGLGLRPQWGGEGSSTTWFGSSHSQPQVNAM